jgi:hypothetical protein
MKRKLAAACLAFAMTLGMSACGYQGWVRYPCQEFENWEKPECNPPQCETLGLCTKDLFDDEVLENA